MEELPEVFAKNPVEEPIRLSFSKGMDESQSGTVIPLGYLTDVRNWEPEPTGGLRVRIGWNQAPATGDTGWPATRRVRGLFWMGRAKGTPWWVMALEAGGSDDLWAMREDFTGDWQSIIRNMNVDLDAYPMAFAKGEGDLLFSHPDMTHLRSWDGDPDDNADTITEMTKPGRAVAYYKNRFFSGGAKTQPWRLWYSKRGTTDQWDMNDWYLDIGRDDGEPIEDLCPYNQTMLVGKEGSVWVLSGSGTTGNSTFRWNPLSGGNCARGRSLIPTPKGVAILGDRDVWMWDGSASPELISSPIRQSYYAGRDNWRMGAFAGSKLYITSAHSESPTFVFDMDQSSWHMEDVGDESLEMMAITAYRGTLVGGIREAGTVAPVYHRDVPFQNRNRDAQGVATVFSARTPDYWFTKGRQPIHASHLWLRLRQRGGNSGSNSLEVTPYVNGIARRTQFIRPLNEPGAFYRRLDFPFMCRSFGLGFGTTVPVSNPCLWDIEEAMLDIDVEQPQ